MRTATQAIPAAILCAIALLSTATAARADLQPTPKVPTAEERSKEIGSYDASAQLGLLEQALEHYRDIESRGGWKAVPTDLVMGPGYSYDCARIARLERRLIVEGYLRHSSTPPPPMPPGAGQAKPARREPPPPPARLCAYGPALTTAMREFQIDRKIIGFGQLASQTMAQLNRPVEEIVDILEHDVARWKHVPLEESGTYLLVNIPFYELSGYQRGREHLRMQVIVGQPTWQTPQFSDALEFIIVNPDWGIPEKIAAQEYWPTARRDKNYLRHQGITASGTSLRQKPGPNNPLGRIKFVMPNPYDVYLHDTPTKRAFTAAVGALSHGCIRLSNPMGLAHYLLSDDEQWDPRHLDAAIATGKTMQINLRQRVPVHIIYSTSRVGEDGRLELRPDVYGLNRRPVSEEARSPRASDESLESWP